MPFSGNPGSAQPGSLVPGYGVKPAPSGAQPTISSVTPSSLSANGGTSVSISGTGFQAGLQVLFGGVAGTNVVVNSSTSISCTAPTHAPGTVNLVVLNPDWQGAAYEVTFAPGTHETQTVVEAATTVSAVSAVETQTVVEVASGWTVEDQIAQVAIETLSYDAAAELDVAQSVIETLSSVAKAYTYAGVTALVVDSDSATEYVAASQEQTFTYAGVTTLVIDPSSPRSRDINRTGQTDLVIDPTSPRSRTIARAGQTDLVINPTSPTGTVLPNTFECVGETRVIIDPTSLTDNRVSTTSQTQTVVEVATNISAAQVAARQTQIVVEAANDILCAALQTQLVIEVATHYYIDPCSDEFRPGADLCEKRDIVTWVTWDPGDGVRRLFTQVQIPDLER